MEEIILILSVFGTLIIFTLVVTHFSANKNTPELQHQRADKN